MDLRAEKFSDAMNNNDIAAVKSIINDGFDVNSLYNSPLPKPFRNLGEGYLWHVTPLLHAAYNRNVSLFETLLELGADPTMKDDGGTTLFYHIAGIRMEIETNIKLMEILLKRGVDINCRNTGGYESTPLIAAAFNDKTEATKFLIEHGADIDLKDHSGKTALMWSNNADVSKLLLNAGADVNVSDNDKKRTPLMEAASRNNGELVKILLDAGAEIDARDYVGNTALILSIPRRFTRRTSGEHIENATKILVAYGANLDCQAQDGRTALHIAVSAGSGAKSIVTLLLKAGANQNIKDNLGEIPIDRCRAKVVRSQLERYTPSAIISKAADKKTTEQSNYEWEI